MQNLAAIVPPTHEQSLRSWSSLITSFETLWNKRSVDSQGSYQGVMFTFAASLGLRCELVPQTDGADAGTVGDQAVIAHALVVYGRDSNFKESLEFKIGAPASSNFTDELLSFIDKLLVLAAEQRSAYDKANNANATDRQDR